MQALTTVLILALVPACGHLPSLGQSSTSSSSAGSTNEKPAAATSNAHDKLSVLDLKIGMAIDQPGFVCAKPSDTNADPQCVKFVDTRCANLPAGIGELGYHERAPKGCYLDYSSNATYLDSVLQQTSDTGASDDHRPIRKPLESVHLVGTQSKPAKIYRIDYMLGLDDLSDGSKLYTATSSKYGEPSYKNPPNEMRWKADTTSLKADCDRAHCEILVEDTDFERAENAAQAATDGQARQQAATAPKL